MARSLAASAAVGNLVVCTSVMDGLSGPVPGGPHLHVLRELVVVGLTVDDEQALRAVALAFQHLRLVAEPAGTAALAAVNARPGDFAGRQVARICPRGPPMSVVTPSVTVVRASRRG